MKCKSCGLKKQKNEMKKLISIFLQYKYASRRLFDSLPKDASRARQLHSKLIRNEGDAQVLLKQLQREIG